MSEEPIKRDDKGRWVEGNPPGPGRPKGKTIKERVRDWLEEHPDDMEAFVKHFITENKELAWQMLEGRPSQDTKIEGELKIPLYLPSELLPKNDIPPIAIEDSK